MSMLYSNVKRECGGSPTEFATTTTNAKFYTILTWQVERIDKQLYV